MKQRQRDEVGSEVVHILERVGIESRELHYDKLGSINALALHAFHCSIVHKEQACTTFSESSGLHHRRSQWNKAAVGSDHHAGAASCN